MKLNRRSFAGGALAGGAVAALGLNSSSAQDSVTLDFPYLWTGPEGEALQAIVDSFNESQDAIEVRGVSNPDMQRMIAQMASNDGFDISDAFDNNIGPWASTGAIMALDDLISNADYDTSDFIPSTLDRMVFNDQIYAMPIAVHTSLLLKNDALFEADGVAYPTTTEELADVITALTKVDGDGRITQLGMNQPDFLSFAFSFGGRWLDDDLQPTANHEGNIAALQFWVDNVLEPYGVDEIKRFQSGFGEYASPQNPFYTGKVAMVLDGEWQARFIQLYAEDLQWSADFVPNPASMPELAGTAFLSASMFFIPTNSGYPEEAFTFMEYLLSPEPMRDFTIALANLPTRTSLLEDPAYAEIPGMSYWLESLTSENLMFNPSTSWEEQYRTEITSTIEEITNLRKSPEDALNDLQEKALELAEG